MKLHERLKIEALAAIERIFSDTSVGAVQTKESLEELRDAINAKIECLDTDIKRNG